LDDSIAQLSLKSPVIGQIVKWLGAYNYRPKPEADGIVRVKKDLQTFPDGTQYVGEWDKQGRRSGKGAQIYGDSVYEGYWLADKKHGKGRVISDSGFVYVGDWRDGLKHGQGKYTDLDGSCYEGQFISDLRHGQGKLTDAVGQEYTGNWKSGKKHGQGKEMWFDGREYKGMYSEDKFEG